MKSISVLLVILCLSSLFLGCTNEVITKTDFDSNEGITASPIFEPTCTPLEVPAPYFGNHYIKGYRNNEWGFIASITVGKNVINSGGPGNVFVSVIDSPSFYASKVFFMDKGEELNVIATFNTASGGLFNFSVRAALPGDISQGNIEVKRP